MPSNFIPLCVPEIHGNEWKYIKECLDSGWVSSIGSYVDRFETEFAQKIGTRHAIATVNGTAALHIALLVAGVEPDDEVLVSTLTFIAPVNAIRYCGAFPVFIDAEAEYFQIDVQKVSDFLTQECQWRDGVLYNKSSGRRIRAILPVHILGHPVDFDAIWEIAQKYDLPVIEDATESLGASYKGRTVGHLGHIACFSFNGNKLITTGGGGMIVTDNPAWAQKAKYLTTQAKDNATEFIHHQVGYNYRLTNLQAAMGVAQLEVIDSYIAKKCFIAKRYQESLANIPGLRAMQEAPWATSAFWLYTILVDAEVYAIDSRTLLSELGKVNIQTRPLWQPAHLSPSQKGIQSYHCEVADQLNRSALSLPCSVGILEEEQQRVLDFLLLLAQRML